MSTTFQPKLMSARPRVSAALQDAKLKAPAYNPPQLDSQGKPKKKRSVAAALMAATGNF